MQIGSKRIGVAIVALILMAGCGPTGSTVSGVVKMDGKALGMAKGQRGTVFFQPVDGGSVSTGSIDEQGRYEVMTGGKSGLLVGDYYVGVRATAVVSTGDEDPYSSAEPLTPFIYSNPLESGFRTTIALGENTFDIDLDSNAGPLEEPKPDPPAEEADEQSEGDGESAEGGSSGETEDTTETEAGGKEDAASAAESIQSVTDKSAQGEAQ